MYVAYAGPFLKDIEMKILKSDFFFSSPTLALVSHGAFQSNKNA